jgi:hypothetical protein
MRRRQGEEVCVAMYVGGGKKEVEASRRWRQGEEVCVALMYVCMCVYMYVLL